LRNAFAALAQGDLDTRVGSLMGKRRDELSDLGQNFDHMAGQIHNLVHAQQRLLHDVSHELRSPLARIQAAIGLAQQQPEKIMAMMERIERESQRISDLVGELLVLSRLEAGVSGSESHDFDIGGLLDDIVENARFEAEQYGVVIRYDGIEETVVKGRSELLHRAIENVLRNALQHCKKGGEVAVIVRFDTGKRRLQVAVYDQGPGVAESDLSAIFEPFFRSGDRGKADSIGLGLAIAYRAIEAHAGRIQASNRPQGGLRIEINIPFTE
jgi:two-component system OmpR family sensor kinase